MLFRLIFILIMFLVSVLNVRAADFYVNNSDSDCNPASPGTGTIGDPFTNPHYALYQGGVSCGDTLIFRGGTYQSTYDGFNTTAGLSDRADACDDDNEDDATDGSHTLVPLLANCTSGNELILENFAGETVILEGTDAEWDDGNIWTQCESASQCGTATGLALPDPTGTYYTEDFNHGSGGFTQIWVNPSGPFDPGIRLQWVGSTTSNGSQIVDGTFGMKNPGAKVYIVNMPAGLNDDPDLGGNVVKVSAKQGDAAGEVITADGSHIIVRKNAAGGNFVVKYGYYGTRTEKDGNNITFDGVDFIAHGGRDYGGCTRVENGDNVTYKNGRCEESMAHGIFFYGGGPNTGFQTSNNTLENFIIKNMGRGWVDGGGVGNNLGTGVIIKNCENCTVRSTTISGTYRNGIQVNHSEDFCDVSPTACSSDNVLIEGNTISNFCRFRTGGDPNTGTSDCAGINIVTSFGDNGTANNPIIQNNMIFGNFTPAFTNSPTPRGIQLDAVNQTQKIIGAIVRNNSVHNMLGACISNEPTPDPMTLVNNIMSNCGGCNGPDECGWHINDVNAGNTHAGNNYFPNGSANCPVKNGANGQCTTIAGLAVFEPSALAVDPLFVSNIDLHLTASSPMINAGSVISVPTLDLDGQLRSLGGIIDIGADEFIVSIGFLEIQGLFEITGQIELRTP